MASGIRLFSESSALRHMAQAYPGSFSTEFMFRSAANPFSHLQFIPERIVEFSISPDGIRFYKVQWQQTWIPEHHLLQYQNIVEVFWQSQNELSANCENNNQSSRSIHHDNQSSKSMPPNLNHDNQSSGGRPRDGAKPIKPRNNESFLNALQSDNVDLVDPTLSAVSLIIEKPLVKEVLHDTDLNTMKQSFEQDINHHIENSTNEFSDSVLNLINTDAITLPLDEGGNDDIPLDGNGSQVIDKSPDIEECIVDKPAENELSKVISQRLKTNKARSLQLDGFEIVNIENTSVSEEDIRIQAREVLCTFNKKRPRCPNGSSQLPHACFFCTKVLSSRKKLREHQFSIHFKNVGEFECGICQQRFAFRRKLKAHMITHSDNRSFVCEICGLTCKRRTHLHTHMETHNKERNYRCDVCHKNFKVQADLKSHCLNEHKNQVSKCNVCKHTLQTAFSVYIHSMRHSGTRDHTCDVCGASFKSKHHLTAHQKTHTSSTDNIKCPACDKEFPDKKYFRKHLELIHKELAPTYRYDYICTICDKDFAYKGRLDEHMKTHEEETEEERNTRLKNSRKKKVESMSEEALAKLSDKIEKITTDTGEIKLKCKLCRRREFRLISTMEKHLDDHEAGYKFEKVTGDFECAVCKKVLHSEARLLRHNRVHETGEKLNAFQCRMCMMSFKWKSCLQTHMKKCNPISKGAGKRKATLKAKEKLRRQNEESSSEEQEPDFAENLDITESSETLDIVENSAASKSSNSDAESDNGD